MLINLLYRCFPGRIRQALWLEDSFFLRPQSSCPSPLPEHLCVEVRGKPKPQPCELGQGSWRQISSLFSWEKNFCKILVKEGENKAEKRTSGGDKCVGKGEGTKRERKEKRALMAKWTQPYRKFYVCWKGPSFGYFFRLQLFLRTRQENRSCFHFLSRYLLFLAAIRCHLVASWCFSGLVLWCAKAW